MAGDKGARFMRNKINVEKVIRKKYAEKQIFDFLFLSLKKTLAIIVSASNLTDPAVDICKQALQQK